MGSCKSVARVHKSTSIAKCNKQTTPVYMLKKSIAQTPSTIAEKSPTAAGKDIKSGEFLEASPMFSTIMQRRLKAKQAHVFELDSCSICKNLS